MRRRNFRQPTAPPLAPGQMEYEFGIPIAGTILERAEWAATALKRLPEPQPLDWEQIFGRPGRVILDIGCGNGRYTIASALDRPECNHLAIDSLPAVIRYGTRRANQRGLHHTRFAVCDGWRMLHDYCGTGSLDEIHIYHPQPYADPNKAALRMLTPDFIGLMYDRLAEGGKVVLQTDRSAYWQYIERSMSCLFDWSDVPNEWQEGPTFRSRREILARKQGLHIYRGFGVKRGGLSPEQIAAAVASIDMPVFDVEP